MKLLMLSRTPGKLLPALMLLATAFHAGPAQAQAPEEHVLPVERCGNYFLVPLSVNGDEARTLTFIFDTGASRSIIDPDALERVSGKRVRTGKVARFSDEVTIGPATLTGFRARVQELDHLQRTLSGPMDGILGFRVFQGMLLVLDYSAGEMRVAEGKLGKADGKIVFDLDRKERARPWLPLSFGDIERTVLIDSGSSSGISLREHRAMVWREPPVVTHESTHINRYSRYRSGRLAMNAAFAGATLENPVVTLTDNTELVGTKVLQHFVITFDQKRRRVRFVKAEPGPVVMDGVRGPGVTFRARKVGLEVTSIVESSAAAAAGLRIGDRVVAVDGRPTEERGCGQPLAAPDADSAVFTVERDGGTIDIIVPFVDLVP